MTFAQSRRAARLVARSLFVGALGYAAMSTTSPRSAHAFCRTSSCEAGVGALCSPAQPSDCGVPLFWPTRCVGYSVQRDASSDIDLETATAVTRQAFDAWESASCTGAEPPSIEAVDLGPVSCGRVEYNQDERNANVIVFRDEDWPASAGPALALTTVTFALESGQIRDADIELNSAAANFTTSDQNVDVDLLSILTHETGHFLGLSHVPSSDATMFADYAPMSTTLRTLEPDDEAGICAAYPPGESAACEPEPRNGLGDVCADGVPDEDADDEGCSVARASTAAPTFGAAAWIAIAIALSIRARAPSVARRQRRADHDRRRTLGCPS